MGAKHFLCSRQLGALYHAVMDEGVGNDQIFRPHKATDKRHIGCVSAHERNRILGPVKRCQSSLEFPMYRPLTCRQPARRARCSIDIDRLLRRADYLRMAVQAEIVVRREINEDSAIYRSRIGSSYVMQTIERVLNSRQLAGGLLKFQLLIFRKAAEIEAAWR